MTWNHRLVDVDGEIGLYEVYYDGLKPIARAAEPATFVGESRNEVVRSIRNAANNAASKRVLWDWEISGDYYDGRHHHKKDHLHLI